MKEGTSQERIHVGWGSAGDGGGDGGGGDDGDGDDGGGGVSVLRHCHCRWRCLWR